MPPRFDVYWYKKGLLIKNAFLFNCRDDDLTIQSGAQIPKGSIVSGTIGYVAAEELVPGSSATLVPFEPNRRCAWQDFELACMAHPDAPTPNAPQEELRRFNYIVAELPNPEARALARRLALPVLVDDQGRNLVNLEIARFERQGRGSPRRAKIL